MSDTFAPIRKLSANDAVAAFDCGQPALNLFLRRHAWTNQQANSAQTYVCCYQGEVVAYYSLAVGGVDPESAPGRVVRGLARNSVPVMLLARLAVATARQRRGLGKALLRDALLRTVQVADIAGIRALLVHAKDEDARNWYRSWEFETSPTDPYHLFLLLKDLKALL